MRVPGSAEARETRESPPTSALAKRRRAARTRPAKRRAFPILPRRSRVRGSSRAGCVGRPRMSNGCRADGAGSSRSGAGNCLHRRVDGAASPRPRKRVVREREARVASLTSDAGSKVAAVSRCFHGFDVVAPELGFGASVARSESSLPRSYRPYAIDCLTNRYLGVGRVPESAVYQPDGDPRLGVAPSPGASSPGASYKRAPFAGALLARARARYCPCRYCSYRRVRATASRRGISNILFSKAHEGPSAARSR